MRIYVRTAQFPAVARVKKGRRQKGGRSCEERSTILIPCLFLTARWPPLFKKQKGGRQFPLFSGERRFRDQSVNTSQASSIVARDARERLIQSLMLQYSEAKAPPWRRFCSR